MDSPNPSESASNINPVASSTSLSLVVSPLSILDVFKGVTSDSAIASLTPVVMKVCELYASYICVMGSEVSSVAGTKPVESSCGGTVSDTSGDVSVKSGYSEFSLRSNGSFKSRSKIRSARRAASWRAKNVPKTYPQGYCYARCFQTRAIESIGDALQKWPTVQSVLLQPGEVAHVPCMMEDYRLVRVADNSYHVAAPHELLSSFSGVSFVDAMIGLSRRYEYPVGTYGHLLRTTNRIGISSEVGNLLKQGDLLGGTEPDLGKAYRDHVGYGKFVMNFSYYESNKTWHESVRKHLSGVPDVYDSVSDRDRKQVYVSCFARPPTKEETFRMYTVLAEVGLEGSTVWRERDVPEFLYISPSLKQERLRHLGPH